MRYLQMLAEAVKLQAEATLKISDAIERMAKNEERQTTILEYICKTIKKT